MFLFTQAEISSANSESVAVVIGANVAPYLQARDAFIERLKPKKYDTFYLSLASEKEIVSKVDERFSLIYAIGESALNFSVNHFPKKRIVFSSVLNPSAYLKDRSLRNIVGISSIVSAHIFQQVISELKPQDAGTSRIIALASPSDQADFVVGDSSKQIPVVVINTTSDALKELLAGRENLDALISTPSPATLSDVFITNAISDSIRYRFVYPGHSRKMTELGCLFSLSANPVTNGIKAADLIKSGATGIHYYSLQDIELSLNRKTAELLGIQIPTALLHTAKWVY